jgi:NADPH:quinone reductase-like Zn-dependent oxidoreductase
MKAAVIENRSQAPKYQDFPDPIPGPGETIAEMRAAGLHPIVKALASGQHYSSGGQLPAIPGIDGVGQLPDGSLAYCFAAQRQFGTMAERTLVIRDKCIPLPAGLDPLQAAAIANPGMSAWLSLKSRAGLAAGETVLILGATGVAGQLAVQAARYLCATKIIAAGRNLDALQSLNIDAAISLTAPEEAISEAFASHLTDGIDVVIDFLWGRPTELYLGALAKSFQPEGSSRTRLVEVGTSAGATITLPGALLRSVDLHLSGSGFGSVPLDQIMSAIPEFFSFAAQGHFTVTVESVPLSQVETAWTAVEKGKRIVFSV